MSLHSSMHYIMAFRKCSGEGVCGENRHSYDKLYKNNCITKFQALFTYAAVSDFVCLFWLSVYIRALFQHSEHNIAESQVTGDGAWEGFPTQPVFPVRM